MKIRSYILAAGLLASGLAFTGCSSVLEETDRQGYTPEYFKTEKGWEIKPGEFDVWVETYKKVIL